MSDPRTINPTGLGQSAMPLTDVVLAGVMDDLGQARRMQLPLEGEKVHVDLAKLDASKRVHQEGTEEYLKNKVDAAHMSPWRAFAKEHDGGDEDHGQSHRHKLSKFSKPVGGNLGTRDTRAFRQWVENATSFNFGLPATGFAPHGGLFPGHTNSQRYMQGRRGRGGGFVGRLAPGRASTAKTLAESLNNTVTRDTPNRRLQAPAIESGVWGPGGTASRQSNQTESGAQFPAVLSFHDPRSVNALPVPGVPGVPGASTMPPPATTAVPSRASSIGSIPEPTRRGGNVSGISAQARSTISSKSSRSSSLARPNKRTPSQPEETLTTRKPSLADPDSFMSATAKLFSAAKEPTVSKAVSPTAITPAPAEVTPKVQASTTDVIKTAPKEVALVIQSSTTDENKVAPDEASHNLQSDENKAASEGGLTSDGIKVALQGSNEGSQPTAEVPASPPVTPKLLDLDANEVAAERTGGGDLSSFMRMFGLATEKEVEDFNFSFQYPINGNPEEDNRPVNGSPEDKPSTKDALPDGSEPERDRKGDSEGDLIIPEIEPKKGQDADGDLLISFDDVDELDAIGPIKPESSRALMEREFLGLGSQLMDVNTKLAALSLEPEADAEKVSKADPREEAAEQSPKNEQQASSAATSSLKVEPSKVVMTTRDSLTGFVGGLSVSRFADDSVAASSSIQARSDTERPSKRAQTTDTGSNNGTPTQEPSLLRFGTFEPQQTANTRPSVSNTGMSESRYAPETSSPLLNLEKPPSGENPSAALRAFSGNLGLSRWAKEEDTPPRRRMTVTSRALPPAPITVLFPGTGATAGGSGAVSPLLHNAQGQSPVASPRIIYKPVTIRDPRTGEVIRESPQQARKDDNTAKSKWTSARFR